jgi:hypothetical protein
MHAMVVEWEWWVSLSLRMNLVLGKNRKPIELAIIKFLIINYQLSIHPIIYHSQQTEEWNNYLHKP